MTRTLTLGQDNHFSLAKCRIKAEYSATPMKPVWFTLLLAGMATAQVPPAAAPASATSTMPANPVLPSGLLIQGTSKIGTVDGVTVEALELHYSQIATTMYKLRISVHGLDGAGASIVNEDAIDNLLKALDYLQTLDKNAVRLDQLEGVFTMQDLEVCIYTTPTGERSALFQCGNEKLIVAPDKLPEIADLIRKGQAKLKEIQVPLAAAPSPTPTPTPIP